MGKATIGQVLNLVSDVQHEMRDKTQQTLDLVSDVQQNVQQGFAGARVERLALEQRLTGRIDYLQEQVDQVRETQIEDSQALSSVLVNHKRRLTRLEKTN